MDAYPLSFDNTENAFAYKSTAQLRKARWLFSTMGHPWLVKLGTRFTPWAIRTGLPVRSLIRNTLFDQFVGGETLEETAAVAATLARFGVQVILDYGVEGKQGETAFDSSCDQFIRVIRYAAKQRNMPFISIKVTGIARFGLLEKLDRAAGETNGYNGVVHTKSLTAEEVAEWERVVVRMDRIVRAAAESGVGVLVDAEESWIQDPVDALTMQVMETYNRSRAVVYNTIQLYRHDRLNFMQHTWEQGRHKNFLPAVKLVRGAYMEKERSRAEAHQYSSPIQPDKAASDRDYNAAIGFCVGHLADLAVIIASHNEYSNLLATQLMAAAAIPSDHPHIHFSQLFGMSDNITFNLARAGYSVSKYLPFGPIGDVIPYLMRRAQENSSVSGQTGRELILVKKEIERRRAI